MKKLTISILSVFLISSCGDNDSNDQPPATDQPTTAATPTPTPASTPAPLWTRAELFHSTDIEDEDCTTVEDYTFNARRDGSMTYDPQRGDCGQPTQRKTMSETDRAELNRLAEAVARSNRSQKVCTPGGNESPSHVLLLPARTGQEEVYSINGDESCVRGDAEAVNELYLKLYALVATYFPTQQ